MQLHVSSAFEFFENYFVHAAPGFDQRGGENGKAAAFFNIARRAEEFFGFDKCLRLDAARHDSAFAWLQIVVPARYCRAKSPRLVSFPADAWRAPAPSPPPAHVDGRSHRSSNDKAGNRLPAPDRSLLPAARPLRAEGERSPDDLPGSPWRFL